MTNRQTNISPSSLRGYIYEAAVDMMFENAGFTNPPKTYQNPQVKMKGRVLNNQIDCIKLFPMVAPFAYPFRLLVEVKGWRGKVGAPSVLKFKSIINDISEFGNREFKSSSDERILKFGDQLIERFIDVPVFVSLKGFSMPAQEYGMLNGICLLDHSHTPEIISLTEKLAFMVETIPSFKYPIRKREIAGKILTEGSNLPEQLVQDSKFNVNREKVLDCFKSLFSVFGTIDGRVPVHIICKEELPNLNNYSDLTARIEVAETGFILKLLQDEKLLLKGNLTLPKLYLNYVRLSKTRKKKTAKLKPLQEILLFYKKNDQDILLKAKITKFM